MSTLTETLRQPTDFLYAAVGAGDLAVERVRSSAADLRKVEARELPKRVQDTAKARVDAVTDSAKKVRTDVETRATKVRTDVETRVTKARTEAQSLPERAKALALSTRDDALRLYADLAARGKQIVHRIRERQAAESSAA